ncbi:hypothetical protein SteCoe_10145 [Stentor coeruleus]|uniref:Uncharacterized protein n=1 Tax=Stentor coeruleus TaxID=5963 RepID=A0A1R2CG43_9CILI|nr:hypothetical protein SteCoe_10145 [Stentor coeruleus]
MSMNKYQDLKFRHNSTRSFTVFPSIKQAPSTVWNTLRGLENGNFSILFETSKGFLDSLKNLQESKPQNHEFAIKSKLSLGDHGKDLTNATSLIPSTTTTDSCFLKSQDKKPDHHSIFHSNSSDSKHFNNLKRTKTISDFSAKQNEIINSYLTPRDIENKKFKPLPEITVKAALPTDREFSKLIENLNEVVSPKNIKIHTILQENELTEVIISESKMRFFKVYMKNKKVPLSIKIKKNKGKLYTYASTTTQEPGTTNYEKCFMSDYFEIRDSSTLFKYDVLYLGIKAFEDSQFKISIAFGHQVNSLQELKKLKRQSVKRVLQESMEIDEIVEETTKEIIKPESKSKKNFIAVNKHKSADLIDKVNAFTVRATDWKTRREQILQKKKKLIEIKKNKALDSINKRTLRLQMEKIRTQESQAKAEKNQFSCNWLALIAFFSCTQAVINIVKTEKNRRLRRISMNLKAMQIQTVYKNYTLNLKPDEAALYRARNLLAFYRGNTKDIEKRFVYGRDVIFSITQASHAQVVFRKFSHFYKSVIKIQRNTRKYLSLKERRMRKLIKIWGAICECMLFKKGSKKEDRRRQSLNIVAIPVHIRDKFLQDYYRECMLRYRKNLREYIKTIRNLSEIKLFKTVVVHMCNNKPPKFQYIPTTSEMEKIIEISIVTRL